MWPITFSVERKKENMLLVDLPQVVPLKEDHMFIVAFLFWCLLLLLLVESMTTTSKYKQQMREMGVPMKQPVALLVSRAPKVGIPFSKLPAAHRPRSRLWHLVNVFFQADVEDNADMTDRHAKMYLHIFMQKMSCAPRYNFSICRKPGVSKDLNAAKLCPFLAYLE